MQIWALLDCHLEIIVSIFMFLKSQLKAIKTKKRFCNRKFPPYDVENNDKILFTICNTFSSVEKKLVYHSSRREINK